MSPEPHAHSPTSSTTSESKATPKLSPDEAEAIIQRSARIAEENRKRHRNEKLLGIPPPSVPVVDPQVVELAQRTQEERDRQAKIDKLVTACSVPGRYREASLVNLRPPNSGVDAEKYHRAAERVNRLAEAGGILALIGPCGAGKTWIACGMVLDLCRRGTSARYLHAFDYLQGLKQTYGDRAETTESRFESNHLRPKLLVIDEVEERGATEWEDRMLRRLIVKRQDERLATLILSNLNDAAFKQCIGEKVQSRMQEDAGGIHVCAWANLRGRSQ